MNGSIVKDAVIKDDSRPQINKKPLSIELIASLSTSGYINGVSYVIGSELESLSASCCNVRLKTRLCYRNAPM